MSDDPFFRFGMMLCAGGTLVWALAAVLIEAIKELIKYSQST